VGGQYLEFHTYNSHGNCFYVYLMPISTFLYVESPDSDYLDLQTDIRAKLVTYAIFGFLGPYKHYRGYSLDPMTLVGGQYLEFHRVNSHENFFYV
jgi:hypothetical protein